MLSNRVAAKRAYHRRVEKMESLQKENSFLTQILSERQQRKQHLEALVGRSPFVRGVWDCSCLPRVALKWASLCCSDALPRSLRSKSWVSRTRLRSSCRLRHRLAALIFRLSQLIRTPSQLRKRKPNRSPNLKRV